MPITDPNPDKTCLGGGMHYPSASSYICIAAPAAESMLGLLIMMMMMMMLMVSDHKLRWTSALHSELRCRIQHKTDHLPGHRDTCMFISHTNTVVSAGLTPAEAHRSCGFCLKTTRPQHCCRCEDVRSRARLQADHFNVGWFVCWSLTSLFSTKTAISETISL